MESGSLAGDSKTLAYVNPYFTWNNGMYGAMALFTIDLDTHVKTIVDTSAYFPDWSPVESRLVFCTSEHEISLQGYIPQQIAVFDPATGTGTKLTEGNDFNANPDFSPDGNWIVYSSDAGNHGTFELWKMASDGSQKTQLSENLELSGMNYGTIGLGRPVWSPDAEYIYFNRLSDEAADMDIFRMPSPGGVAEPVIQSPWNDYIPAVSPDHTKTAFISDRSGSVQIWLYEPASGRYRQVTGDGRFGILTDWGKLEWVDAETILFSGYETDTYSKYGVFTVKIID
jgi:Tol biopolymer transport system component